MRVGEAAGEDVSVAAGVLFAGGDVGVAGDGGGVTVVFAQPPTKTMTSAKASPAIVVFRFMDIMTCCTSAVDFEAADS